MKSCIIISFYPESIEQESILIESINSVKKLNLPIILVSHKDIRNDVYKSVDYFIYDKENILLNYENYLKNEHINLDMTHISDLNGHQIRLFDFNTRLVLPAVCKSLYTAMKFATSMEFTHAHIMVGDVIFDESDLSYLKKIENDCQILNKKSYFELVPDGHYFDGIESVYWFNDINWFLNNFLKNFSYENLIEKSYNDFYFERFIYTKLKDLSDDVILYKKSKSDNLISFSTSKKHGGSINFGHTKSIISIFYCNISKSWATFISNSRTDQSISLEFFVKSVDLSDSFSINIQGYHWWYKLLHVDNAEFLNLKILQNDKKFLDLTFDSEMLTNLKSISNLDI